MVLPQLGRFPNKTPRLRPRENPSRGVWIAGALGASLLVGGATWWFLRKPSGAAVLGKVVCAANPYTGVVNVDDYVVVQLGTTDGSWYESTWGKVTGKTGTKISVVIVGETDIGAEPKPLSTIKHGFSIGDKIEISKSCIFDRFRPGQKWKFICGPNLFLAGYHTIDPDQASLLGIGDSVRLVVRDPQGNTDTIWATIDSVSAGSQTLRAQVDVVSETLSAPITGDVVEFLRDCVTDAEFKSSGGFVGG